MKRVLTVAVLGLAFVGSVGCSSAPKQEEAPAAETMSQAEESELDQAVNEEPAKEEVKPEASTSDYSLGAGSSGRGH